MTPAAALAGSTRLRVLAVTPRYLPLVGGTEIHTYETARRMAAAGHNVTVLTANPGRVLPAREWSDGVQVLRVPCWPARTDYYLAPRIAQVVREGSWDLVHCQGAHTLVPPLAMLAAARAGIPYVVTFHSGGHSSRLRTSLRGTQHTLLRPLLARAARLIGVSAFEAAFFQARLRLPPERFVIIPNGVQFSDGSLPEPSPAPPSGTLIVSVGRVERYKGHQRVIAALPAVLACRPDARLRIVGSGPYEPTLRQLARHLGVADRVEIGPVSASDRSGMAALLRQASLVTLLSEYESQGIAVMEALQLKRPVLVAANSALHGLAERGLVREISLRSTPQSVAAAILEQLEQPLIPADLTLPSWDDCTQALLDVYQSVLRRPACAS